MLSNWLDEVVDEVEGKEMKERCPKSGWMAEMMAVNARDARTRQVIWVPVTRPGGCPLLISRAMRQRGLQARGGGNEIDVDIELDEYA